MGCSSAPLKALNLPMFSMFCTRIRLRPLKLKRSHLHDLSIETIYPLPSRTPITRYYSEAAQFFNFKFFFFKSAKRISLNSSVLYKPLTAVPRGEASLAYGDD